MPSSSTSMPVDTTFSRPAPDARARAGWIIGLSRPSTTLGLEPVAHAEHAGDREAPDVGVEHADGVAPAPAIAAARLTVTDSCPRRPCPDAMASTRVRRRDLRCRATSPRASQRAFSITSDCARPAVISPHVDRDAAHAGMGGDPGLDVLLDLGPQRAAGDRQLDADASRRRRARPSAPVAMPRSTMLPPSSGSMTPRRSPMTSSTVGGPTDRADAARCSVPTACILPAAAV